MNKILARGKAIIRGMVDYGFVPGGEKFLVGLSRIRIQSWLRPEVGGMNSWGFWVFWVGVGLVVCCL